VDGTRIDEDALMPFVVASCEEDEEREAIESEGLGWTLTERLPSKDVLSFGWESRGAPTSSSDSMLVLTVDRHIFLCMPTESLEGLHPFLVLAAALAEEGAAGVSAMVRAHLPGLFGDVWTLRLPTETTNLAPDLLSAEAVKEAYRSAAQDPDVWDGLLTDLAELSSGITPADRLAGTAPSPEYGSHLDDHEWARLFDEWFALSYQEARP
jgi:hypothetical protein